MKPVLSCSVELWNKDEARVTVIEYVTYSPLVCSLVLVAKNVTNVFMFLVLRGLTSFLCILGPA